MDEQGFLCCASAFFMHSSLNRLKTSSISGFRPYRLTRLGAGYNAPLAAVPVLGQCMFGEVAALEPPDSPDVTGRDDCDPNEKIVDRARLVGACGPAPAAAVPVCDQDL